MATWSSIRSHSGDEHDESDEARGPLRARHERRLATLDGRDVLGEPANDRVATGFDDDTAPPVPG